MIPVLNKRSGGIPEGAVYIGRPSRWGNPYSHLPNAKGTIRVDSREEAIEAYEGWLDEVLRLDPHYLDELQDAKALVCWCAPLTCHGDVIAKTLDQLYGDFDAGD